MNFALYVMGYLVAGAVIWCVAHEVDNDNEFWERNSITVILLWPLAVAVFITSLVLCLIGVKK